MSGICNRAKRYHDRAEECLQIVSTSQTPGTGETYLEMAEHYLRLAVLEMTSYSLARPRSHGRGNEPANPNPPQRLGTKGSSRTQAAICQSETAFFDDLLR
jgi:hypothetical protein